MTCRHRCTKYGIHMEFTDSHVLTSESFNWLTIRNWPHFTKATPTCVFKAIDKPSQIERIQNCVIKNQSYTRADVGGRTNAHSPAKLHTHKDTLYVNHMVYSVKNYIWLKDWLKLLPDSNKKGIPLKVVLIINYFLLRNGHTQWKP